ncbi:MAG: hypothetical protein HOL04_12615 [Gammaproteobacteria bacterium]|jgi:hypothetical protein|nr:hypothetical protein [Gammaproteobacteria bacterium]MBT4606663.1 hypothetical protein [Thiotrichales bacterium]MBT3968030.1 hypothetical protein [Gammaproteobacteria bacterium]MBT4079540.1 hypothetical protein [Gammaproteobacteria bacterium]MBT4330637.1 hypothetical protein [Gammaproteobacteria bacterium]
MNNGQIKETLSNLRTHYTLTTIANLTVMGGIVGRMVKGEFDHWIALGSIVVVLLALSAGRLASKMENLALEISE